MSGQFAENERLDESIARLEGPGTETTVRIEREHRWFEYGQWFTGFGSSMDPHTCNDPGVVCQWLKRTVTTVATPWVPVAFTAPAAPESQPGEA